MVEIVSVPIGTLKVSGRNARTHSRKQVQQIKRSIEEFGFCTPIVVDQNFTIIAGHGRLEAARLLNLDHVPVVQLHGLSEARARALMLADNRIAASAGWDREKLAGEVAELGELLELEALDISITGFEPVELDQLAIDLQPKTLDQADNYDEDLEHAAPVSRIGDIWQLGKHRLMCGNARNGDDLNRLMQNELADVVFTDPPYNTPVAGIVGRGRTKHREFFEASGEMSNEEFRRFLEATLGNAARVSRDGALSFVCMDWRGLPELLAAGRSIYGAQINLVAWVKTNAGQGSFYRSQHELILVYRVGTGKHLNNVELGKHGRSRSNVWTGYAGVNTFKKGRLDELRAHPTVKPTGLVADALRDCTKRGDVVLDVFAGSGSTILAAERIGRRARAMEIDPVYVDVAIKRWQSITGEDATLASTGAVFSDCARD